MPTILLLLLFALASFPAGAQSASRPDCSAPPASDGWQVAAPDAVGLDPTTLCGIGPRFKAWTAADIHSVLVVRHGKLVYEQYFTGADEKLGRPVGVVTFDAVTKHDLRSIEKSSPRWCSVSSLIRGGCQASISRYCRNGPSTPNLRSPQKDQITLRP
jgi:hypothetical protein